MSAPKRILAVASGGGHWVQLLRLRPAFQGHHVTYVTTLAAYRGDVPGARFHVVADASRWSRFRLLRLMMQVFWLVIRERPQVVITTGAAPGYFAVRFGRWLGARTLWLDSIANVEQLSMTGRMVRKYATLRLTQWPHLATAGGPEFGGAVL